MVRGGLRPVAVSQFLPSGVIATATGSAGGGAATAGVGWVATDTVPTGFTFLPSIASTVTESSARLATSANVPARLIAIPEACLPASTVPICAGGDAVRSITQNLLYVEPF